MIKKIIYKIILSVLIFLLPDFICDSKAIKFCKRQFGAIEIYGNNTLGEKSIIHAEIKTADSVLIGPMNSHISTATVNY